MTSEEFRELEHEANSAIRKIADEFGKRIKELYDIAQEKGHYPEFGWTEGEVEEPDYDDFETEEEGDEAYEKYEDFCSAYISFVWSNDHNFTIFDGYSFEIDEDGNVAFTSVESAEDEQITAFGGGSFEDLTRIAMINAPLWTELFISNSDKLVEHIEGFQKHLEEFKVAIKNNDSKKLNELLSDTREKRIRMGSIRTKI